ncbi:multidrug effflux MFS transporter [Afifella pfennigii]|uniref:multidrug effflux MFS transporter n=1 Tax=Afifella pfennigii TaxID=209897 RepID=UPI00146F9B20|nr:multidrug effflux MFS transporter [Afifella pfennigii]
MSDATLPQQPGRRPSLVSLVIISTLSPFAINVIVPSMPALQVEFDADFGAVQLVLSLFLASIAVSQIAIGPLSDRFGRRPVLLAGLAIFTVASFLAVAATSIESLVALRVVQAAGGCTGIVLGRAIVRDLYDRAKAASVIGYVTMGLAMGPMIAPFVGGLLQEVFGWQAQFWLMGLLGALTLLVAWRDVSETNHARAEAIGLLAMLRHFGELLALPAFRAYTAVSSLSTAVFFSFLGGAAYVADTIIGLSPVTYGSWFAIIAVGYAFGNFLSGRFAERADVRRMTLLGSLLLVATVVAMTGFFLAGIVTPATLFLPMGVGGIANGLVLPSTIAGAISLRTDIAGAAAGLQGASQIGGGAIVSAIAGAVLAGSTTPMPLVMVMGVCALAALFFSLALLRLPR